MCQICGSESRDRGLVMVVEQPRDLIALEQTGMYRGVYHVLMGRISPMEGVGPGDLTVSDLLLRVEEPARNSGGHPVREVVLGLNPTLEADGTALYLAHELQARGVTVTRLARGLLVLVLAELLLWGAIFEGGWGNPDAALQDNPDVIAFLRRDPEPFRLGLRDTQVIAVEHLYRFGWPVYDEESRLLPLPVQDLYFLSEVNPRIIDLLNVRYVVGGKHRTGATKYATLDVSASVPEKVPPPPLTPIVTVCAPPAALRLSVPPPLRPSKLSVPQASCMVEPVSIVTLAVLGMIRSVKAVLT